MDKIFDKMTKWGGTIFAVISVVIGIMLFIRAIESKVDALDITVKYHAEGLSELKSRTDRQERKLEEMERKLDVVISILERLDKKMNHP